MKKINFPIIAIVMSIITFLVISCSQDENTIEKNSNSMSQRIANPTVKDLQDEFIQIMQTSEYLDLEKNITTLTNGLNGNKEVPIDNKEVFAAWINSNLSKTNFTNSTEALNLYDEFLTLSENYINKHKAFYDDLESSNFTKGEIALILKPQLLSAPIQTTNNASPCQNYCMDECEANIDFLNAGYVEHNGWATPRGRFKYWISYAWIVTDFNNCMSGC